ncbi:MAG TPA: hypothetical protein VGX95_01455 [Xanthobacteraceae bacterium]|jgi:hypothetical protein|nr:hypothetical protein [Xanthobacteraceae bacterium]
MSALPIFDETLREFVPAPAPQPARAAPARARVSPPPPPSVRVTPPVERDERLCHFQSCLARVKQTLEAAGHAADATTLGELVAFLHSPQAAKALADERDHRPIYAVAAAYVEVLTAVSDESAAAQTLARKLIALGYDLPKQGGDTRGWKRLLLWRDNLARGLTPADLRETYERALKFARKHPTTVDLKAALDHAASGEPPAPA